LSVLKDTLLDKSYENDLKIDSALVNTDIEPSGWTSWNVRIEVAKQSEREAKETDNATTGRPTIISRFRR